MKIYDAHNKRVLSSVTLFLTPNEAKQLGSYAEQLAHNPDDHHSHFEDDSYTTEITIAVYTPQNINQFDDESRAVIGPLQSQKQ